MKRIKRMHVGKIVAIIAGALLLITAFQNCGQQLGEGFQMDQKALQELSQNAELNAGDKSADENEDEEEVPEEQSTGDLCEDQLYAKFGSGYYVFLKNNCASCHNGDHEAPGFASKNSLMSYQVFKDKGYQLISTNALSAAHNPPYTGTHHTGTISSLKTEWESAVNSWVDCKGGSVANNSVVTGYKTNAAILENKANAAYWGALSWNMSTAADMPTNAAKFPLSIKIEAQVAMVSGNQVGYAVRNPIMSLTTGTQKYRVKGLFFYVNDKLLDSATVYRNIDAVICAGTPVNLAPVGNAQLLVLSSIKATDKFALQFSSIEKVDATAKCGTTSTETVPVDNTPATVSFTQLVSNDPKLGVFKSQCLSCHTGAGARAGLDLTNYNAAKAKASVILTRINDAGSPMPTNGLMSSAMRAVVEKWVSTGAPK
ncbi:hypothetical protein [Bdellovibrio reynosensis]|uniref:Cytochrome c domain-containing protein n=1 Tax=Bdellovibrio reynosensis TaxID=2835041 RepID=A0ABY4CBA0_9BACT|nr:hypothetical protein [Bdellovibrio reynosensis]UOF02059.1 hypothetical protein MNR06_03705 [Bdellovibrio reynosensis]